MKGIVHPFTKALYEQDGEGNIRVTDGDRSGIFTVGGRWIRGRPARVRSAAVRLGRRSADRQPPGDRTTRLVAGGGGACTTSSRCRRGWPPT